MYKIFGNVYGYEITPITMLHIYGKVLTFSGQKCDFKIILGTYDREKSTICARLLLNLLSLLQKSDTMCNIA